MSYGMTPQEERNTSIVMASFLSIIALIVVFCILSELASH